VANELSSCTDAAKAHLDNSKPSISRSGSPCMSGNEGLRYTSIVKTSPHAGSVTQPVSAPMSRSRVPRQPWSLDRD